MPIRDLPDRICSICKSGSHCRGKRGVLNAFHNAKRAIDCQMDRVIWNLGIKQGRLSMPRKFEILRSVEAGAPKLLARLIQKRNLLEHAYKTIAEDQAEEAIDLAELYVNATDSIARNRTDSALLPCKDGLTFLELSQEILKQDSAGRAALASSTSMESPNAIGVRVFRSEKGQATLNSFMCRNGSFLTPRSGESKPFSLTAAGYVP